MSVTELTIPQPDDFHLHLRDGANLASVAPCAGQSFSAALIMPNLQPPVTNAAMALSYRQRIVDAINPADREHFTPLMTLYLTLTTTVKDIEDAAAAGIVGLKLYPAGATTNSHQGVPIVSETIDQTLQTLFPVFGAMVKHNLVLCIHSEVTDPTIDIFDRESTFLSTFLPLVLIGFPELKVVLEHITTSEAVDLVSNYPQSILDIAENSTKIKQSIQALHDKHLLNETTYTIAQCLSVKPNRLGATITAHHLLVNRNAIFAGGLNPHYYCLPVLKSEQHRVAILKAATSTDPSINVRFFAGTDSAPHDSNLKHSVGCAGCYTAYAASELYATSFASVNALNMLEDFMCHRGRQFYELQNNQLINQQLTKTQRKTITLVLDEQGWTVPETYEFGAGKVVPFMAGKKLFWKIKGKEYPSQ